MESWNKLQKQWRRIFGEQLQWGYHIGYWVIMFVLYWLNYFIWNESKQDFHDNLWLALCNVVLDGFFAYFHLLFIEEFFRERIRMNTDNIKEISSEKIMSPDKAKQIPLFLFWFCIIIILAMCNGMLYSITISWLYHYDFLSPSQVGKLDWIRNVPEACFAMLTTTGFMYAARWGKNKTEREAAEIRLSARKLGAHYISGRLTSLNSLVKKEAWEEVKNYLNNFIQLTSYYRATEMTAQISLQSEIDFLRGYVELEKRPHIHKKEVEIHFDADDISNPNLQIHSLLFIDHLDNAFKHGFSFDRSKAFISIKLSEKDGTVNLWVENKKYVETEHEKAYKRKMGYISTHTKKGVGLEHNKNRLEETYPEPKHNLNIVSDNPDFFWWI